MPMSNRFPPELPGLREALRMHGLPRRKPTEADRPPPQPLPGPKPNHIPGQLELTDTGEERP
jgi:hypothetical protein